MLMIRQYVPIWSFHIVHLSALRTHITNSCFKYCKLLVNHICRLEAKMRAEGKIIARDYMTPQDREWLEMDIEDSIRLADGVREIPFYERDEWITRFGRKP